MRKLLAAILIICASLSANGCDFFTWKSYTNKDAGFTVSLPRYWDIEEGAHNFVVMARAPATGPKDNFQETVSISVAELPEGIPLTTFYDSNKEELLLVMPKIHDMQEGQVFQGLQRGQWMVFSSVMDQLVIRMISCVWIKGKAAYIVTGVSLKEDFPKYEPIYRKIINTFHIR